MVPTHGQARVDGDVGGFIGESHPLESQGYFGCHSVKKIRGSAIAMGEIIDEVLITFLSFCSFSFPNPRSF